MLCISHSHICSCGTSGLPFEQRTVYYCVLTSEPNQGTKAAISVVLLSFSGQSHRDSGGGGGG